MPDQDFFGRPPTRQKLLDILFIFCKLNRDVGYRQGMHELLAPILSVVDKDAIEPGSLNSHRGSDGNDGLLRVILDADFIEHDAFTLFSLIMQTAKSFYELSAAVPDANPTPTLSPPGPTPPTSAIIERSQQIHQEYLNRVDPQLAEHLTKIDILPQIFLM